MNNFNSHSAVSNVNTYNSNIPDDVKIGKTVYWTIHDNRYDYNVVANKIQDVGLTVFKPESKKKCFLTALRTICKLRGYEEPKKIDEDTDKLVYGIISSKVVKELETVNFNHHTVITFKKDVGEISGHGEEVLIDDIRERANFYENTVADGVLRSFCTETLKSNGAVALRQTGGIYFMPKTKQSVLDKLSEVIENSHAGVVYQIDMVNGEQNTQAVVDGARQDFESRLDIMQSAILKVEKRLSSLFEFQGRIMELEQDILFYAENFNSDKFSELFGKIITVGDMLNDKIIQFETEKNKKQD